MSRSDSTSNSLGEAPHNLSLPRLDPESGGDRSFGNTQSHPATPTASPLVQVDGVTIHDADAQASPSPDTLTYEDEEHDDRLELELRRSQHEHRDNFNFSLAKDIPTILSRDKIASELERLGIGEKISVDVIRPKDPEAKSSGSHRQRIHVKVFALLLLLQRQDEIARFVQDGVCDEVLPLLSRRGTQHHLYLRNMPNKVLSCFKEWRVVERESFDRYQYQISAVYLAPQRHPDLDLLVASHHDLEDQSVLPWCAPDTARSTSTHSKPLSVRNGGYGTVQRIRIYPKCHGFQGILQELGLSQEDFALKTLHPDEWNDRKKFENEVDLLKGFSGLVHRHLVTLLATFTQKQRYNFLFPYAECDLDAYWETRVPNPSAKDIQAVRWFSNQIQGIMEAVSVIHNPKHISTRFGRHGDLKPDNILWYRCTSHPTGMFVISDMGLSSLNREGSRSNIPNKSIPPTPGYRPPECDLDGGTISRSYDIWTLGCLFMEMTVWFLGGHQWLREFQDERLTVYINGSLSNIFFDVKVNPNRTPDGTKYVVQLKPKVTEWFDKIRGHRLCTQFILDVVDEIERKMLIVSSTSAARAPSTALKDRFNALGTECMRSRDYCTTPVPRPTLGIVRTATAVEANLNEKARETISTTRPNLSTYEGGKQPRKSLRRDEMEKMY